MRLFKLMILIFVLNVISSTQENRDEEKPIHRVPFLSSENVIELSVQNISELSLSGIKINVIDAPSWLNFKSKQKIIEAIASNGENTAEFIFSVDKSAVVNKEESISFTISTPTGEVWTKQIKIVVTPPERFELYQNYPNPFNPTTTISYQLPQVAWVNLKVHDILGREVATLLNEMKEAGYYEVNVDGTNLSTGVYFYRIQAGGFMQLKKMMVVR